MEATEVDEFEKEVKEGAEKGMRHVSLAISILAVMVAMVTVLGHRTHTEAVLLQTRAADQWNEYQAKKIRQQVLSESTFTDAHLPSTKDADVQAKIAENKAHVKKWEEELPEEQSKAHDLEGEVRVAEGKAWHFDLAEALLSIAVVLSSVTLLTRQNQYFLFGVFLGLCGVVIAATAFLVH